MTSIADQIIEARMIAILRGDYRQHLDLIATTLRDQGVCAVEVTLNSPDALKMIGHLAQHYGDSMLIGAGTVLEVDGVTQAAAAGARFIVSPDTYEPVVHAALAAGLEPLPGVQTATEIRTAIRAGAKLLKLFPATLGGPDYLRQLSAPLDTVQFVPTGGISAANAADYIRAGAVALGLGSWLVPARFDGSTEQVTQLAERARAVTQAVQQALT